jgi:hypothetical protein
MNIEPPMVPLGGIKITVSISDVAAVAVAADFGRELKGFGALGSRLKGLTTGGSFEVWRSDREDISTRE